MAYLRAIMTEGDFKWAVKILENAAGEYSGSALKAANQLADLYEGGYAPGVCYDDALSWQQRAVQICETVFGKMHTSIAVFYNNLALVYVNMDNYAKACEFLEKALKIDEFVIGNNTPTSQIHIAFKVTAKKPLNFMKKP